MPTIPARLEPAFRSAIREALGFDADPLISVAQNERFGDYQANAAMGLAKQVSERTGQKANPRQIAEQIKAKLELGEVASEVSIAGPGFINVRLSPAWLAQRIQQAERDERVGVGQVETPEKVVVDYSGPNIAKEMHVGHLRGTIIGDAIARVLGFQGQAVIRQNHIGDWGLQMGMVTFAVEREGVRADQITLRDLERLYKQINTASEDPTIRRQMAERTKVLQRTPKGDLRAWQQVRELTLTAAQQLYERLDVTLRPEHVRGESFYAEQYETMVNELLAAGQARETEGAVGVFPPGFVNREGEPRPFLIRSRDGTYQYPTFDLAALRFRILELGAERVIYTHDSRQAEHFMMLFAVVRMLGLTTRPDGREVQLEYAPFGTVLGEDGRPLKTRSGENVKLVDLLDEAEERAFKLVTEKNPDLAEDQRKRIAHAVGVGAVKYADLSKDRTSDYVFSWDKMLSFEGNTAPYLQNAHVRVHGIFRRAAANGIDVAAALRDGRVQLDSPFELSLVKHILRLGEIVDLVARELKPHHLCNYLYELATRYHAFFENCPVLQSEEPVRSSRLKLCDVTARTLARGLDLLGIEHPEQM